jgi:phage/plasmid-like protein (TIGR03299 family)
MPHELSIAANGEAEMFYIGDTPWHGLGQRLDGPATAEEALAAAHLDWTVALEPVYRGTTDWFKTRYSGVDPYRFIVRQDNGKILGLRTEAYSCIQNVDSFGLFDAVMGPGLGQYHTAGALRDGKIVWILAKMGSKPYEVVPGDTLEPYILLSTSHDGSLGLTMRPTIVRVICSNTLHFAFRHGAASDIIRIRHSGDVYSKAVQAREGLGLSQAYFERMMEGVDGLVTASMTDDDMERFARVLVTPKLKEAKDEGMDSVNLHRYTREAVDMLQHLFTQGRGQEIPGVKQTAWAAYNAATEFVDYYDRVGHGALGEPNEYRLEKAWFGPGRTTKSRAWSLLQDFAKDGSSALHHLDQALLR